MAPKWALVMSAKSILHGLRNDCRPGRDWFGACRSPRPCRTRLTSASLISSFWKRCRPSDFDQALGRLNNLRTSHYWANGGSAALKSRRSCKNVDMNFGLWSAALQGERQHSDRHMPSRRGGCSTPLGHERRILDLRLKISCRKCVARPAARRAGKVQSGVFG